MLFTLISSCDEPASIYEGQWINTKGEILTIKQLNELYFIVKGCPEMKKGGAYITGKETFLASMANDGKLYIGLICALGFKDEQLIVEYLLPFDEKPFVYEKVKTAIP